MLVMPEQTLLGFDFGTKRIGIAVGQTLTKSARPLQQISSVDWSSLDKLIAEWRPAALVVGLPLNMDDSPGKMAKAATEFAAALREHYSLLVHLCDERLSSREALERLAERGNTKPSKAELNCMAAAVILESWLHA
jgi:putative Holliday junction resolvase